MFSVATPVFLPYSSILESSVFKVKTNRKAAFVVSGRLGV